MKYIYIIPSILLIVLIGVSGCEVGDYKIEKIESNSSNEQPKKDNQEMPSKLTCDDWAKSLIPEYLILSVPGDTPTNNFWKNNKPFPYKKSLWELDMNCYDKGSAKGENVNYYYLRNCKDIRYAENIVSKKGIVLGTREFTIRPILTDYENNVITKSSFQAIKNNPFGVTTKIKYIFEWTGFNDDIKRIYNTDKIKIKLSAGIYPCDEREYSDESGSYTCESYTLEGDTKWIISPDIKNSKIFKIIKPNIVSCNYIDGVLLEEYVKDELIQKKLIKESIKT